MTTGITDRTLPSIFRGSGSSNSNSIGHEHLQYADKAHSHHWDTIVGKPDFDELYEDFDEDTDVEDGEDELGELYLWDSSKTDKLFLAYDEEATGNHILSIRVVDDDRLMVIQDDTYLDQDYRKTANVEHLGMTIDHIYAKSGGVIEVHDNVDMSGKSITNGIVDCGTYV